MALTSVELQGMTAAQGSFQTALDETTGSYAQMDGQIEGLRASWSGWPRLQSGWRAAHGWRCG